MRLLNLSGLLLCLTMLPAAKADYATVQKLFEKQEYQLALPKLQQLAALGHVESQMLLSEAYEKGLGTTVDLNKAYAWALTARSFGHPKANERYTDLRDKLTSRRDGKAAFNEIGKKHSLQALTTQLYPIAQQIFTNNSQAIPLRQQDPDYPNYFSNKTSAWAIVTYDINENGKVENAQVEVSFPQGTLDSYVLKAMAGWTFKPPRDSYGESIRLDHQIHTFRLGMNKSSDSKFLAKTKEYIEEMLKAANQDSAQYQYKLALISQAKLVTGIDPLPWLLKAAINGHSKAQYSIAQCLLTGSLCDRDSNKAINWLTHAADAGDPKASYLLAHQLLNSDNIQFDPVRAAHYLETAALNEYLPAIIEYATLLAMSDDPEIRDPVKAAELAEQGRAIDSSHPKLLSALGVALIEQGQQKRGETLLKQSIASAQERKWAAENYEELLQTYQGTMQAEMQ